MVYSYTSPYLPTSVNHNGPDAPYPASSEHDGNPYDPVNHLGPGVNSYAPLSSSVTHPNQWQIVPHLPRPQQVKVQLDVNDIPRLVPDPGIATWNAWQMAVESYYYGHYLQWTNLSPMDRFEVEYNVFSIMISSAQAKDFIALHVDALSTLCPEARHRLSHLRTGDSATDFAMANQRGHSSALGNMASGAALGRRLIEAISTRHSGVSYLTEAGFTAEQQRELGLSTRATNCPTPSALGSNNPVNIIIALTIIAEQHLAFPLASEKAIWPAQRMGVPNELCKTVSPAETPIAFYLRVLATYNLFRRYNLSSASTRQLMLPLHQVLLNAYKAKYGAGRVEHMDIQTNSQAGPLMQAAELAYAVQHYYEHLTNSATASATSFTVKEATSSPATAEEPSHSGSRRGGWGRNGYKTKELVLAALATHTANQAPAASSTPTYPPTMHPRGTHQGGRGDSGGRGGDSGGRGGGRSNQGGRVDSNPGGGRGAPPVPYCVICNFRAGHHTCDCPNRAKVQELLHKHVPGHTHSPGGQLSGGRGGGKPNIVPALTSGPSSQDVRNQGYDNREPLPPSAGGSRKVQFDSMATVLLTSIPANHVFKFDSPHLLPAFMTIAWYSSTALEAEAAATAGTGVGTDEEMMEEPAAPAAEERSGIPPAAEADASSRKRHEVHLEESTQSSSEYSDSDDDSALDSFSSLCYGRGYLSQSDKDGEPPLRRFINRMTDERLQRGEKTHHRIAFSLPLRPPQLPEEPLNRDPFPLPLWTDYIADPPSPPPYHSTLCMEFNNHRFFHAVRDPHAPRGAEPPATRWDANILRGGLLFAIEHEFNTLGENREAASASSTGPSVSSPAPISAYRHQRHATDILGWLKRRMKGVTAPHDDFCRSPTLLHHYEQQLASASVHQVWNASCNAALVAFYLRFHTEEVKRSNSDRVFTLRVSCGEHLGLHWGSPPANTSATCVAPVIFTEPSTEPAPPFRYPFARGYSRFPSELPAEVYVKACQDLLEELERVPFPRRCMRALVTPLAITVEEIERLEVPITPQRATALQQIYEITCLGPAHRRLSLPPAGQSGRRKRGGGEKETTWPAYSNAPTLKPTNPFYQLYGERLNDSHREVLQKVSPPHDTFSSAVAYWVATAAGEWQGGVVTPTGDDSADRFPTWQIQIARSGMHGAILQRFDTNGHPRSRFLPNELRYVICSVLDCVKDLFEGDMTAALELGMVQPFLPCLHSEQWTLDCRKAILRCLRYIRRRETADNWAKKTLRRIIFTLYLYHSPEGGAPIMTPYPGTTSDQHFHLVGALLRRFRWSHFPISKKRDVTLALLPTPEEVEELYGTPLYWSPRRATALATLVNATASHPLLSQQLAAEAIGRRDGSQQHGYFPVPAASDSSGDKTEYTDGVGSATSGGAEPAPHVGVTCPSLPSEEGCVTALATTYKQKPKKAYPTSYVAATEAGAVEKPDVPTAPGAPAPHPPSAINASRNDTAPGTMRRPLTYEVMELPQQSPFWCPQPSTLSPSSAALLASTDSSKWQVIQSHVEGLGVKARLRYFANDPADPLTKHFSCSHNGIRISPARALIDDGASTEIISKELADRLRLVVYKTNIRLSTSTNTSSGVLGISEPVTLHYGDGLTVTRPCLVTEGMSRLYDILVSNTDFNAYPGQIDALHQTYLLRLNGRTIVVLPTACRGT